MFSKVSTCCHWLTIRPPPTPAFTIPSRLPLFNSSSASQTQASPPTLVLVRSSATVRRPCSHIEPPHPFYLPFYVHHCPLRSLSRRPLNSYAKHGMPRPFVHLIGSPLDPALDARIAGNDALFVCSGCRPNTVLRPVIYTSVHQHNHNDDSNSRCDEDNSMQTSHSEYTPLKTSGWKKRLFSAVNGITGTPFTTSQHSLTQQSSFRKSSLPTTLYILLILIVALSSVPYHRASKVRTRYSICVPRSHPCSTLLVAPSPPAHVDPPRSSPSALHHLGKKQRRQPGRRQRVHSAFEGKGEGRGTTCVPCLIRSFI